MQHVCHRFTFTEFSACQKKLLEDYEESVLEHAVRGGDVVTMYHKEAEMYVIYHDEKFLLMYGTCRHRPGSANESQIVCRSTDFIETWIHRLAHGRTDGRSSSMDGRSSSRHGYIDWRMDGRTDGWMYKRRARARACTHAHTE